MTYLTSASPDPVFGKGTYVRSDIADASSLSSSAFCDAVQVGGYKIVNVYKLPSLHWGHIIHLQCSTILYYTSATSIATTLCGDMLTQAPTATLWLSGLLITTLIHDAKQRGTFHSAKRKKDSSPDMCWVSSSTAHSQPASQTVLQDFSHSSNLFLFKWCFNFLSFISHQDFDGTSGKPTGTFTPTIWKEV